MSRGVRAFGHQHVDDELGQLAAAVVARVHPGIGDRASAGDVYQTAYVAGLEARRAALRTHQHTSTSILFLAMQSAAWRLVKHRSRSVLLEADLRICA